jgi:hypothetical protein
MKYGIEFKGRACYRIIIQGQPSQSWLERMGAEAEIISRKNIHDKMETQITMEIRDQTQLSSLLDDLHIQHLPLIMVEYLSRPDDTLEIG